jgi:hypothetical protein
MQVRQETFCYDCGSTSTTLAITELVSRRRRCSSLRRSAGAARSADAMRVRRPQIPELRDDSKAFKDRASVRRCSAAAAASAPAPASV